MANRLDSEFNKLLSDNGWSNDGKISIEECKSLLSSLGFVKNDPDSRSVIDDRLTKELTHLLSNHSDSVLLENLRLSLKAIMNFDISK